MISILESAIYVGISSNIPSRNSILIRFYNSCDLNWWGGGSLAAHTWWHPPAATAHGSSNNKCKKILQIFYLEILIFENKMLKKYPRNMVKCPPKKGSLAAFVCCS